MGEGAFELEAALAAGAIFASDYRIVRLLARGGMGAVYLVEQSSTGKARALKLMLPELAADEDMRRRFQQEARIGAQIESEHIVEIHSAGIDEATRAPYLVMELLDGEDLDARVKRDGPLDAAEAAHVFEQLCHAVAAAHDIGVVHRDLKPNNVFLAKTRRAGDARDVEVKVLDFGIAKLIAETATREKTAGMIGTPLWMAPEQAERGPIAPTADVWALGLILYYVLTGRLYWMTAGDPEATFTQIMKEVLIDPVPPPIARAAEQGVDARLPAAVGGVIARCIARDRAHRFKNAHELWTALSLALRRPSGGSHAFAAPPPSSPALAPAPRGSSPRFAAPPSSSPALDRTEIARAEPGPHAGAEGATAAKGGALTAGAGAQAPLSGPPYVVRPIAAAPGASGSVSPRGDGLVMKIVLAVGVLALVIGSIFVMLAIRLRHATATVRQTPTIVRATPGVTARPLMTRPPVAAPPAPVCRLCTANVEVTKGTLGPDEVKTAVEARFPSFDEECLRTSRRGPRAGTVTVRFTVSGGRATNRDVEAASPQPNAGVEACLERAFSDVELPTVSEPTEVLYTLSFNPAAR